MCPPIYDNFLFLQSQIEPRYNTRLSLDEQYPLKLTGSRCLMAQYQHAEEFGQVNLVEKITLAETITLTRSLFTSPYKDPLDLWTKWNEVFIRLGVKFEWGSAVGNMFLALFLGTVNDDFPEFVRAISTAKISPSQSIKDLCVMFELYYSMDDAEMKVKTSLENTTLGKLHVRNRNDGNPNVPTCYICHRPGHKSRMCWYKPTPQQKLGPTKRKAQGN